MFTAQHEHLDAQINAISPDPCRDIPLTAKDVAKATVEDPTLRKVTHCLTHGWPHSVSIDLNPYYKLREQLSTEAGCILYGNRVVIPAVFRELLPSELHENHVGSTRMKAIARSFFWWPRLDEDVVKESAQCRVCQQAARSPQQEAIHHWVYPSRPFERVHMDFAEYKGQHYLVISDTYSKWCDVFCMGTSTTTSHTISCLHRFTSVVGYPSLIVSDNGPQFTSQEFADYCTTNGIQHKRTPPYHPSSNGQVERLVQELNKFLAKSEERNVSDAVSKFYFSLGILLTLHYKLCRQA